MDTAQKEQIRAGLLKAIQAEQDGYHFYLMAARTTEDPRGREVFEKLAQEELDHNRFLRHQHEFILHHGHADPAFMLQHRVDLSGESPIFSSVLKARIKEAHFEMSALSIGLQLELASSSFYKEEAGRISDPTVRAFFLELASWEIGHYQALLRQQDALRDDYFSDSGFSPF